MTNKRPIDYHFVASREIEKLAKLPNTYLKTSRRGITVGWEHEQGRTELFIDTETGKLQKQIIDKHGRVYVWEEMNTLGEWVDVL